MSVIKLDRNGTGEAQNKLHTKQSVCGYSDFLGKGCVTNTARSFISSRGFSRSFCPFSTVLCVMRAPRVVFWRYYKVLPVSVTRAACELIQGHSLLTWVLASLEKRKY